MLTTQISKMPPSGRVPMSKRHQRDTSEPSGNVLEFPDPAEVLQGLCAQNHQHQLGRPALSSSDQTTRLLEPRLKSQGPPKLPTHRALHSLWPYLPFSLLRPWPAALLRPSTPSSCPLLWVPPCQGFPQLLTHFRRPRAKL